jgi:hypothetical protein
MSSRSALVLLSTALLVSAVGCRAKTSSTTDDTTSLGSSEEALSSDNDESQEAEDNTEDGVENGLSGASITDPGTPASATDLTGLDAKIKTNPGLYFQPAGCLVSTRVSAGVWNHVFTNCTGPQGRVTYNGTITSTWKIVSASELTVTHEATSFTAKGPNVTVTFSGSRVVDYTHSGTLWTKKRTGSWSGTIERNSDGKSESWTHTANFTSTWDSSTKCYTRDGSAENTIGDRSFGRTVTGYKVCGGLFACPQSGELELDRKDGTVKITVTVVSPGVVEITGPRGNTVKRHLLCIGN